MAPKNCLRYYVRNFDFMVPVVLSLMIVLSLASCTSSPGVRRDRFMARGKELVKQKEYSRAILEFRNAATVTPKDPEPYYQMALAALDSGDLRTGVASLRKALDVDPNHAASKLKLAELMSSATDHDMLVDAEKRLQDIKSSNESDSELVRSLAVTELKLGKSADATRNLEEILARSPRELASSVLLARAKISEKDFAGAEEVLKKACAASPHDAMPLIALGDFYYFRSKLTEAQAEYQQALEQDGKNEVALARLSNLQYTSGKKQEAEEGFRRLSQMPDKGFQSIYGRFLFQEGRGAEGVKEFERLAKADSTDRTARTLLVSAYRAMNRGSDARKVLDDALRNNPKDLDALLQRSKISLADGQFENASADADRVLSLQQNSAEARWVRAEVFRSRSAEMSYRKELEEAMKLNPGLLAVRLELAQSLLVAKQPAAALDVLNAAPRSQKETERYRVQRNWALWAAGDMAEMRKGIDAGLAAGRTADFLLQDGMWKSRSGDMAGARIAWEQTLKANPASIEAAAALRDSYLKQKNFPSALASAKQFAAGQPKSAAAQNLLGATLLLNGQRPEARAAFEAAKALDPKLIETETNLAQVDLLDGNTEAGRARVRALVAAHPGDAHLQLWLANLETIKGGDNSAAIEHFQKVLETNPDNPSALNNLAYLLAQSGKDLDNALKLAQRAVELAPDKESYGDTLGWVLYQKGLYSSAVTYFQRAASAPNASPVWVYHLAMAEAKAGNKSQSLTELQRALKLNPMLPEAKLAQDVVGTPN